MLQPVLLLPGHMNFLEEKYGRRMKKPIREVREVLEEDEKEMEESSF